MRPFRALEVNTLKTGVEAITGFMRTGYGPSGLEGLALKKAVIVEVTAIIWTINDPPGLPGLIVPGSFDGISTINVFIVTL